jgi:hypothetical protein
MATRLPIYERQVRDGTGQMPAGRIASAASPVSSEAVGLASIGQALNNIGDVVARKEYEEKENLGKVQVSNILSQGDVYWQQNMGERFKAYKVGDQDMRESIGQDFDTWASQQIENLPTQQSKQYFQTHAASMKASLQKNAYQYQEKALTSKLNAETDAGEQADENIVANDGSKFNEVYARRMETVLARTDIDEGQKIKYADRYRRKLSLAAERGELDRDPSAWYKQRFGTFDAGVGGTGGAGGAMPSSGTKAVADAIYAQESSSGKANTSSVNSQGVTGPMQIQERTFNGMKDLGLIPRSYDWKNPTQNKEAGYKWVEYLGNRYNGDPEKVAAAYYGGEGAVNADGSINRHWINKQRPSDPSVGQYVDSVMGRIRANPGGIAAQEAAAAAPDGTSAPAGFDRSNQPKTYKDIDWEQQLQLKGMAESKLRQQESQFKAGAERTLHDAVAMHNDGKQDPFNLDRSFFGRAFGDQGARMYEDYMQSRQMAGDIAQFKTMNVRDIQTTIEASQPVAGLGYAGQEQRYNNRVKAANTILTARQKDPAGYVTANSTALQAQARAIDSAPADQRPELLQKFTRDNIAEQQRIGISEPKVLTPQQADNIGIQADRAQKPEDSANLIAGLERDYGSEFFPKVFNQLVKEEKLSNELLIIPNLPSQAARESVSRLSRIKESDLTAGIESADQKTVKDQITAKLADFARAVPMMTLQASNVTNSYESVLRKRAYELVQGGTKPSDAVDQAYSMVLGQYEFDKTARYPKGTDTSMVQYGARTVLNEKLGDIDVPRDLVGTRSAADLSKEWQSTVKANPLWYTSDDDGGLELWALGNNGVKYRVTRGGQQVKYSWNELKAMQPPGFTPLGITNGANAGLYKNERESQLRQIRESKVQAGAAMNFTAK